MNAPDLPARILAVIAKASSQHPACAADVLALVGGEEPAFWAAVEQLYRDRRINTAHIQKKHDPAPWLALWPTGVCLPAAPISGKSLSGLFVRHRPNDLYAAHAPRSVLKPEPAPEPAPTQEEKLMPHRRKKGELQVDLTKLVADHTAESPITVFDAAQRLGVSPDNLRHTARRLVEKGEISETEVQAAGRTVTAYHVKPASAMSVEAAAVTPYPGERRSPLPLYRAGDLTVTEVPHPERAEQIEFALWDNGRLTIAAGDEITQIPPDATKRLALLLGVPGTPPVSSLGA